MLSNTAREEVLRKIQLAIGFTVHEEYLTPATRQAITNVATIQRHLFVITEILRGEDSRVERSALLTLASRMGKDSGKEERANLSAEIGNLQGEIDGKISALSKQIVEEENAFQSGLPPPKYGGSPEVVQLKCPQCGASLPIPTGRYTQCQYCNATLTVQDVSSQIRSMIQNI